jgi:hypothetical protein
MHHPEVSPAWFAQIRISRIRNKRGFFQCMLTREQWCWSQLMDHTTCMGNQAIVGGYTAHRVTERHEANFSMRGSRGVLLVSLAVK